MNKEKFLNQKKVPFKKMFPKIQEITMSITENQFYGSIYRSFHLTNDSISEIIECSNPKCKNGGFNIKETLNNLYKKQISELKDSTQCENSECKHYIDFEIKIEYIAANK